MLVLTRKSQERIHIGDNITITVVKIKGNTVRVGIEAPGDVRVIRGEIGPREGARAAGSTTADADGDSDANAAGRPRCASGDQPPAASADELDLSDAKPRVAPLARVAANRPRLRLALPDSRAKAPSSLIGSPEIAAHHPALPC